MNNRHTEGEVEPLEMIVQLMEHWEIKYFDILLAAKTNTII